MDEIVPVNFICSPETETERIIYTSIQTASGYYFGKRFAVLPRYVARQYGAIYLPRLNYHLIPDYWAKLKKYADNGGQATLPLKIPREFLASVLPLVEPVFEDLSSELKVFESEWQEFSPRIWEFLKVVMPYAIKNITSLEVRFTSFGGAGSFSKVKESPGNLIFYLRREMGFANIFKGIVYGVLAPENKHIGLPGEGIINISDYFVYRLKQMELLPPSQLVMTNLQDMDPKLFEESKKYMKELGLSLEVEKLFKISNGLILFKGVNISQSITSDQSSILKLLIRRENELISYDEIGDVLYSNNNEDFSLWAITRQVQRLRNRLVELGMDSSLLGTIKGKGYVLNN